MGRDKYPVPSCWYPVAITELAGSLGSNSAYWVPVLIYFFVALPSITWLHVVPSVDISNLNV
jgi:hypothetical protein